MSNLASSTDLMLKIIQGFTTDERDLSQPYNGPEYYRVVAWTNTDKEDVYGTKVVKSNVKGYFFFIDEKLVIPLDRTKDQYLYIELHKEVSWRDPGTSNGTIVMGRGKVRLPPSTKRGNLNSKVELVGLSGDRCVVLKGYLVLSMELRS